MQCGLWMASLEAVYQITCSFLWSHKRPVNTLWCIKLVELPFKSHHAVLKSGIWHNLVHIPDCCTLLTALILCPQQLYYKHTVTVCWAGFFFFSTHARSGFCGGVGFSFCYMSARKQIFMWEVEVLGRYFCVFQVSASVHYLNVCALLHVASC